MSFLHLIEQSALACRLGWTLVHTLWAACAVGALLWAVLLTWPLGASSRYVACCVALGAIVLLPVVAFCLVGGPAQVDRPRLSDEAQAPGAIPSADHASLADSRGLGAEPPAQKSVYAGPAGSLPAIRSHLTSGGLLPWLAMAWAGGVLVLSVRQAAGWITCQRMRCRQTRPVGARIARMVAALARELRVRAPVRVLESMLVKVPSVVGWLEPMILLPVGLVSGLSPQQLRAILVHELAHIRRYDYLVNLLQSLAETLLFFHPVVWLISARIRQEREDCCDDVVLRAGTKPTDYADSLLHLAHRVLPSSARLLSDIPALSLVGEGSQVQRRIIRLIGGPRRQAERRPLVWPVTMVLVAALAGCIARSTPSAAVPPAEPSGAATVGPDIPPEQAVVVNPGAFWRSTGWATYLDTAAVTMDYSTGWPRLRMTSPDGLHIWYYKLAAPVHVQRYPIAVMTYRARNTRPDDYYVFWMDDTTGPNYAGLLPFLYKDLQADGQVHELRRDLRQMDPKGPIIALGLGIRSGDQVPAEFDLLGLRFEQTPDAPQAQPLKDGQPIEVQVVNDRSQPLEGASVTIDAERPNWSRSALTDSAGLATLTPLENPWKQHMLRVSKDGYVPLQTSAYYEGTTKLRIVLPTGAVYGGVVHNNDGQPVAGAVVTLQLPLGREMAQQPPQEYSAVSDDQGRWQTPLLPANIARGNLRIMVAHPDYATEPQESMVPTPPIRELADKTAVLVIRPAGG